MAKLKSEPRAAMRAKLFKKQKGRCAYCDQQFPLASLTLDHYLPASAGGMNTESNLRLSCSPCNGEKRDMLPYDWILHQAAKLTNQPRD